MGLATEKLLNFNPYKSNHLLRMVMEPKYLSEEVIVHPNHHLTGWLDPLGNLFEAEGRQLKTQSFRMDWNHGVKEKWRLGDWLSGVRWLEQDDSYTPEN